MAGSPTGMGLGRGGASVPPSPLRAEAWRTLLERLGLTTTFATLADRMDLTVAPLLINQLLRFVGSDPKWELEIRRDESGTIHAIVGSGYAEGDLHRALAHVLLTQVAATARVDAWEFEPGRWRCRWSDPARLLEIGHPQHPGDLAREGWSVILDTTAQEGFHLLPTLTRLRDQTCLAWPLPSEVTTTPRLSGMLPQHMRALGTQRLTAELPWATWAAHWQAGHRIILSPDQARTLWDKWRIPGGERARSNALTALHHSTGARPTLFRLTSLAWKAVRDRTAAVQHIASVAIGQHVQTATRPQAPTGPQRPAALPIPSDTPDFPG